MTKSITTTDLKNYINVCKKCNFDQIQIMFDNIDKGIIINYEEINGDEYDSLINIAHDFEKNTINKTHDIYTQYYDMKGGKPAARRRVGSSQSVRNRRNKEDMLKGSPKSPKEKHIPLTHEQMKAREKRHAADPKTGFFGRMLTHVQNATGTLNRNGPVTAQYMDVVKKELVMINHDNPLDKYDEDRFMRMTIGELDKYIEDRIDAFIDVTDSILSQYHSELKVIFGRDISSKEAYTFKTTSLEQFKKFIKEKSFITNKDIEDNKDIFEYVFEQWPITEPFLAEIKAQRGEYIEKMNKSKVYFRENVRKVRANMPSNVSPSSSLEPINDSTSSTSDSPTKQK